MKTNVVSLLFENETMFFGINKKLFQASMHFKVKLHPGSRAIEGGILGQDGFGSIEEASHPKLPCLGKMIQQQLIGVDLSSDQWMRGILNLSLCREVMLK